VPDNENGLSGIFRDFAIFLFLTQLKNFDLIYKIFLKFLLFQKNGAWISVSLKQGESA